MGSSAQRIREDNKRAHKKGSLPKDQQFVQLINAFRQAPAWLALSFGARCLYVEMKALCNGYNNGRIACSVRHAASLIGCADSTAAKYFRELQDMGFIVEMQRGYLSAEGHGQASLWRLTELGFVGINNGRPTKNYLQWQPKKTKPRAENAYRVCRK